SEEMLLIGEPALRIISISYIMAAIGIVLSTVFQAIGNGLLSLIMSVTRQIVVLLPMAYLLANTLGIHAVWWSFPVSEGISLLVCLFMFRWVNQTYIAPLGKDVLDKNLQNQ
ncbi:MAG: MATE family efflux transporter, partial [Clostridiales bacterium]|nr:MATE family efflux transporter [Clostridiales bacterium]